MPFTASHAAVAAPLARRGLVLSALAVGSMAPDFEYFLRLSLVSRWGHSLPGVFLFTLPAALAALWLFHAVFKRPLLTLLPSSHRQRLLPHAGCFAFGPPRRFLLIVFSLFAGIISHVLLDAFTHEHGPIVERVAWLRTSLPLTEHFNVPVYWVLQCTTSALGLFVILIQCARWFVREANQPFIHVCSSGDRGILANGLAPSASALFRMFIVFGSTAAALGIFYGLTRVPCIHDLHSFRLFGGHAFVATGTALLLEMLGFCSILNWQIHGMTARRTTHPQSLGSAHAD